jgi:ribonuclease-3
MCVSELLWQHFPDADEGQLTRMRSQLVNTEALAQWGKEHRIAEALRLGRGAEGNGLRTSSGVVADAVEAVIAAAYLEGGLERARQACALVVAESLQRLDSAGARDAKTQLQERVQGEGHPVPRYELVDSWGPDHERRFKVRVTVAGACLGEGEGRSKRAAEREAAQAALQALTAAPSESGGDGG